MPRPPAPPAPPHATPPGSHKPARKPAAAPAQPRAASRAERWSVDAADAAQAILVIPADAQRVRRFEIACATTVSALPGVAGAWLQLTVQADGEHQWQHRVPTHSPGQFDSLDYRFSRQVAVGRALRISVTVACQGARRRTLVIEADEV